MIKKICILTSFFFAGIITVNSQDIEASVDSTEQLITEEIYREPAVDSVVNVREITMSPDSANAWRSRKEFQYIHTLDSLLRSSQAERTTKVTQRTSGDSFMNRALSGGVFKIILWSLAGLFVLVILYQLSKSGRIAISNKKMVQVEEVPDEAELISSHNFDELIAGAEKKEDYRLAIRYQFLKVLQQLRDKNHIAYEPDKTNSRYLREMPMGLQPAFSSLVLQYEFAWYGHYDIKESHYNSLEKDFRSFGQKM